MDLYSSIPGVLYKKVEYTRINFRPQVVEKPLGMWICRHSSLALSLSVKSSKSFLRLPYLQKSGEGQASGTDEGGETGLAGDVLLVGLGSSTLALLHGGSTAGLGAETSVLGLGSLSNRGGGTLALLHSRCTAGLGAETSVLRFGSLSNGSSRALALLHGGCAAGLGVEASVLAVGGLSDRGGGALALLHSRCAAGLSVQTSVLTLSSLSNGSSRALALLHGGSTAGLGAESSVLGLSGLRNRGSGTLALLHGRRAAGLFGESSEGVGRLGVGGERAGGLSGVLGDDEDARGDHEEGGVAHDGGVEWTELALLVEVTSERRRRRDGLGCVMLM
jgi:hypothetical protein